ncbi:hypothetical protein SteCoe_4779 [Stentor coeruleus]|uniref:Uncharacterized protein n=1 Tax=Stentor coeruleus TaxID=5963 RepID=A0A1R2CTX1_9CILI|nr:hypothetical protein SteCoe_4779 [Stentor coeruleus]
MELKDYPALLSCLSSNKIKVPILQTYSFIENQCKKIFFNDRQNCIECLSTRIGGINSILIKIFKDHKKTTASTYKTKIICYAITNKGRISLSAEKVKQILHGSRKLNQVHLIQKLSHNIQDDTSFFSMELLFDDFRYKSEFSQNVSGSFYAVTNPTLHSQARDIALSLLPVLEKSQKLIIENIIFEFVKDLEDKLWLRFIKIIKFSSGLKPNIAKVESYIIEKTLSEYTNEESKESINKRLSLPIKKTSTKHFLSRANTFSDWEKGNNLKGLEKKSSLIVDTNSLDSIDSGSSEDSIEDQEDSNFLEVLARERVKQKNFDAGKAGKITPDDEMLLMEMKTVRTTIEMARLPMLKNGITTSRKTLPVALPPTGVKLTPILRHSYTKFF